MPRYLLRRLLVAFVLAAFPLSALAVVPSDAYFGEQWYLDRIDAPAAWDTSTGSRDVVVAVLDTGVDMDHEDIAGNVWSNPHEIADNGRDDDHNGYADDVYGWDFVDGDNTSDPDWLPRFDDVVSHGTLIAGLIGAQGDNAIGMTGVAWDVRIMSVRVLNNRGSGNEVDVAAGIRYAVDNGADVINLSFAGYTNSSALAVAIREAYQAGVVVVAAMGNDSVDTDIRQVYPACLGSTAEDWVIGVASSSRADEGSWFTNYGKGCADLSAPGEEILGLLYNEESEGFDELYGGPWEGTSVASPLVAGTAALLLAQYPWLTPEQIRSVVKLSVDPMSWIGFGRGNLGAGRLNAARALEVGASFVQPEGWTADSEDVAPPEETVDETPVDETPVDEPASAEPPDEETKTADLGASFMAFGAPRGALPMVEVYRANGMPYAAFQAYTSNFRGGVNVALADIDGDAIPEVIAGADETGGPHVRVFKPYGAVIGEFFAYAKESSHGVDVAAGDVDADGDVDVVTAVGAGVSNDIVVWTPRGEEVSRFTVNAFADDVPLQVDLIDFDSDWKMEFAVSTRGDASPMVAVYDDDGTYVASFAPFTEHAPISLASYDANGDYFDDIAVSTLGANNDVRMFTKVGALALVETVPVDGVGMRIASVDVDQDGLDELFVLPDADGSTVTIMNFTTDETLASFAAPSFGVAIGAFFAAW